MSPTNTYVSLHRQGPVFKHSDPKSRTTNLENGEVLLSKTKHFLDSLITFVILGT